jgi:predicted nuclease of predicted toxin-antitoxin system
MRFFTDQCVPEVVPKMLEAKSHTAMRLRNHMPTDAPDPQVIAKAQSLQAVLVSLNGDFSNIVEYPPSAYGGIIGLQVRNRPEAVKIITQRLIKYLSTHPKQSHYPGKLLLVEAHRIRIKKGGE